MVSHTLYSAMALCFSSFFCTLETGVSLSDLFCCCQYTITHYRRTKEMFKFEVPSLTVGTLDTLMNLSDDLGKTDSIVEGIVRKIERTSLELLEAQGSSNSRSELTVGGVPAQRYIQQFAWDSAKYPNRRPLKELVALIAGGAAGIEEELKQLGASFADKEIALSDSKKKSGGNLMVADLNDALTEAIMSKVQILDLSLIHI